MFTGFRLGGIVGTGHSAEESLSSGGSDLSSPFGRSVTLGDKGKTLEGGSINSGLIWMVLSWPC